MQTMTTESTTESTTASNPAFEKVGVVIPAAGCGKRFGSKIQKQFVEVYGRPLLSYCISNFEKLPYITEIVVVVPDGCTESTKKMLTKFGHKKCTVVEGKEYRHQSIYTGLQILQQFHVDIVVVHDAVRPFVEENVIHDVVSSAVRWGAAGVAVSSVSTLLRVSDDDMLCDAPDRSSFCASEMPQAFKFAVIIDAYSRADADFMRFGTDCLQMCLRFCCLKAHVVQGTHSLWKVTTSDDLGRVESHIRSLLCKSISIIHDTDQVRESTLMSKFAELVTDNGIEVHSTSLEDSSATLSHLTIFAVNDAHNMYHLNEMFAKLLDEWNKHPVNPLLYHLPKTILVVVDARLENMTHSCFQEIVRLANIYCKTRNLNVVGLCVTVPSKVEQGLLKGVDIVQHLLVNPHHPCAGQVFDI